MQQLKLVGKPKENAVEVKDNKNRIVKTITNNDLMWSKVNAWLDNCKQQKENFAYFVVEYRANVHLDGSKDESLSVSTTLERPFKPEGDSYGGCWGCGGSFN